jgi:hypothetical protein
MKSSRTYMQVFQAVLKIVLLALVSYVPAVRAQEPALQQLTAPPPLRVVSREERERIDATKDSKARLRATIELANARLAKAELLTGQNDYESAQGELGKYGALIEDALDFLSPMVRDRDRTRDLYKRLELTLRAHGPRLTAMRRITPLEYAVWIKELEDFARKGRTEALNSFYGQTVVREPQPKPAVEKTPDKLKNSAVAPERRP